MADRQRAVVLGATDARRLVLGVLSCGLRCSKTGAAPCAVLANLLRSERSAAEWIRELHDDHPLQQLDTVLGNVQLHVQQLQLAGSSEQRSHKAHLLLGRWKRRAAKGSDGRKRLGSVRNDSLPLSAGMAEEGTPARALPSWVARADGRQLVASSYPPTELRTKVRVARLGWQPAGTLPAAAKLTAAQESKPKEIPMHEFVSPRTGAPLQGRADIRRLLDETGRVFPSREAPPPWNPPPQCWEAVRRTGGWAFVTYVRVSALKAKQPSVEDWVMAFQEVEMPTFWAATTCNVYILVADEEGDCGSVVVASANQWATFLGVPVDYDHPVRRGLRAVTPSQGRSLLGQSVDVDAARRLIAAVLREVGLSGSDVRYADLCSGMSVAGGAVWDEGRAQLRYVLAAEGVDIALKAHEAAWSGIVERVFADAHGADVRQALAAAMLHLLFVSLRCNVWSPACTVHKLGSTERDAEFESALADSQALIRTACGSGATVIILETSGNVLAPVMRPWWLRLQKIVLAHKGYAWRRQRICPRKLFGKLAPRDRMFIVGVVRGA